MRTLMLLVLLALAGTQVSCGSGKEPAAKNPGPEAERREALAVAQQFLALVDADAIGETYALVASSIKAGMDQPAWESKVSGLRARTGKVLSRELGAIAYMGEVTDPPPGTYFVIQYNSLYGPHLWIERIVVSEEQGSWHIAAYYLGKMN